MYRRSQMEQEQEQFVSRVVSLPVVSTAWTQACSIYQRTKESNSLFRTSLTLAESSVKTFAETTKPYVEKYQPQLEVVNKIACDQLEKLEEKYPVITKPTEELVNDSKEACQAMLKPAIERVNAVKQYSSDKYNQGKEQVDRVMDIGQKTIQTVKDLGMVVVSKSMETPYGQYVADKMNDALTISEDYVEKYLPQTEEDERIELEKEEIEMDEYPLDTLTRAQNLTSKVRRRMYRRAIREFKGIQLRSQENLQKLTCTVDLIQYAKTNMDSAKGKLSETMEATQNKLMSTWSDITSEDADLPDTLEGRTIGMARHITQQLRHSVSTVTSVLPDALQPAAVQERLKEARNFTEDLYQSFRKLVEQDFASLLFDNDHYTIKDSMLEVSLLEAAWILVEKYEDVPAWILTQTKERMAYLQETLSFLTEQLLSGPLKWLTVDLELEGIYLDEPEIRMECNGHIPGVAREENGGFALQ